MILQAGFHWLIMSSSGRFCKMLGGGSVAIYYNSLFSSDYLFSGLKVQLGYFP